MKLTQRLSDKRPGRLEAERSQSSVQLEGPSATLLRRLHTLIIDNLDLRDAAGFDPDALRDRIGKPVRDIVTNDAESGRLKPEQQEAIIEALLDEIAGFGPLEKLLHDPAISDIMINHAKEVFIERGGRLSRSPVTFYDNAHLFNIIQRIVSRVGRRIDESSPLVDAHLPDGSRFNAVVPPISPDGPCVSIRRFSTANLTDHGMVERGVGTKNMMRFLVAAVKSQCNLVVSGGTGSGKTTMLNVLSGLIPNHERVVTIEDSLELQLRGDHVLRMEARPPNMEGKGAITIRDLVKNSLRMRPDRIVVGEVRGSEALDLLQAMNTGHEGSMGTIHANSAKEGMDRLMMMLALAGVNLSAENMARFVGNSLRLIVQVARFADGTRRCVEIAEVTGSDGDRINVVPIYTYRATEEDGKPPGFVFHGPSRTMLDRFREYNIDFDFGSRG